MYNANIQIIEKLRDKLGEFKLNKRHFHLPTSFTRNRVFTLETLFCIIVDVPRLSLSVEIHKSLVSISLLLGKCVKGTKGGFVKARKKIKPSLFSAMNEYLLDLSYAPDRAIRRWKGLRLLAIDGSILDILDSPENACVFGTQGNHHSDVVQARMMLGYDVLNQFIVYGSLGHLLESEPKVVKAWMSAFSRDTLHIYDRGFPSACLQYLHDAKGLKYLMRCKVSHNKVVKAFVSSGEPERIVSWEFTHQALSELHAMNIAVGKDTCVRVRMIRVVLDTGEVEILVTNLLDEKIYPHVCFKALYFQRWGVETRIGFLKNTLQIELSSGRSPQTIYQDFYATIFRANIQALMEQDTEAELARINQKRQHTYAINHTAAAGTLKGEIVKLFMSHQLEHVYQMQIQVFLQNIEAQRRNRKIPRKKRVQKLHGKYRPLGNYKRAV